MAVMMMMDDPWAGASARPSPLWDWEKLSDRDRQGAWRELVDWVDHVLVRDHRLGAALPDRWWDQPRLVEELIRLHELEIESLFGSPISPPTRDCYEGAFKESAERWSELCQSPVCGGLEGPRAIVRPLVIV